MFQVLRNSIISFFIVKGIITTDLVRNMPFFPKTFLIPLSNCTFLTLLSFFKEYLYRTIGFILYISERYLFFNILNPSLIKVSQIGEYIDLMSIIWKSTSFLKIFFIFFLVSLNPVLFLTIKAVSISLADPPLTKDPKRMMSIRSSFNSFFNLF